MRLPVRRGRLVAVTTGEEISLNVFPSAEYIVWPDRFKKILPEVEMAKSVMPPDKTVAHVAPPSVDFLKPVLVAAYRVFATVGCAARSATADHSPLPETLDGVVEDKCVKVIPPSVD